MIATTIEQSKKLVELGIDASTADMTIEKVSHGLTQDFKWELTVGLDAAIKENLFSYRNGFVVPAWSLSALLELMPLINEYNVEYRPIIERYNDDGWACKYYNEETRNTNDIYIRRYGRTPLDATVEMIIWLKENRYI